MKKGMKKWILLCAALVLVFASMTVSAKTTYTIGSTNKTYKGAFYKMYYKGKLVTDDAHPALLVNNNIMIPYEYTLVKNGPHAKATFTNSSKKVTLVLGSRTVKAYVNKKYIKVNGKKKSISTAPFYAVIDGKKYIMLPAKAICAGLKLDYSYVKSEKSIYVSPKTASATATSVSGSNLQATQFKTMSTKQFIKVLGPIAQADYKKTGVLASVTLAQAINESGWGKTVLAQKGNNIFGMKIRLSENTWSGSTWDQKSYVTISTKEEYKGKKVTIQAKFRKYKNVAQSIGDHSAYLKNAKNGSSKRYKGLTSTTSYAKQLSIIQKGGYCTWSSYVSELKSIIKKYNLTQYDKK